MTLRLISDAKIGAYLQAVDDFPTRKVLEEILKAVNQIQNKQFASRKSETDNLTADKELNEMLNGVHLRFVSKGFSDLIHTVQHELQRVPQGCIFTRQRTTNNECVIEGDEAFGGIDAATDTTVTFLIGDPVGSVVTALLF